MKIVLHFRNFTSLRPEKKRLSISEWTWTRGEQWLLSGDNESGVDFLAERLIARKSAGEDSGSWDVFIGPKASRLVSFAEASRLIAFERSHDDSDFTEGGIDAGRTAFTYLCERTGLDIARVKEHPIVHTCGITRFGDRGLKYLSTGEIRRLLLCEALVSRVDLLILENPYDGVDAEGRITISRLLETYMEESGSLLLVMERPGYLPNGITHSLELTDGEISYMGPVSAYHELIQRERAEHEHEEKQARAGLERALEALTHASRGTYQHNAALRESALVDMRNVTVEWSGKKVLENLNWKLERGAHWLIRGPNGSGKTTFLELITGDNPQVFRNDIWLFGKKRGSGETIWEIKERLGIVSYKMHLEYRLVGDLDVESVILSGFHDSIGLYRQKGEEETLKARSWLKLGGFADRKNDRFSELSYGDQRSILILRAVVKNPEILILDEPCHGLDDRHRLRVLDLLETIGVSGTTTLLHVTHDPTEVLPCERFALELIPGETPQYRTVKL